MVQVQNSANELKQYGESQYLQFSGNIIDFFSDKQEISKMIH